MEVHLHLFTHEDRIENLEGDNQRLKDECTTLRALWSWERFASQDGAYRLRDRTIEENIRFLAGQHWWMYHHLLGWKDITFWMSDEEKRWRSG